MEWVNELLMNEIIENETYEYQYFHFLEYHSSWKNENLKYQNKTRTRPLLFIKIPGTLPIPHLFNNIVLKINKIICRYIKITLLKMY